MARVIRRIAALVITLLLLPNVAFATIYTEPEVKQYYGTGDNNYVVFGASNEFDAALALIGKTYTKIQLTTAMYQKLSNSDTGGEFWSLANRFVNNGFAVPSWMIGNLIATAAFTWDQGTLLGSLDNAEDYTWSIEGANASDIDKARRDYETILSGGSLGGGSGSGGLAALRGLVSYTTGQNTYGRAYIRFGTSNDVISNRVLTSGSKRDNELLPNALSVVIDTSNINFSELPDGYETEGNFYIEIYNRDSSYRETGYYLNIFYLPKGSNAQLNTESSTIGTLSYNYYNNITVGNPTYYYTATYVIPTATYDNGVIFLTNLSCTFRRNNASNNITINAALVATSENANGGNDGPNNWPEPVEPKPTEPVEEPEPPELPTPTDPTLPPITTPTVEPDPPEQPVSEPTNTSPTDYTPWLRAILAALNRIDASLTSHCNHLQGIIAATGASIVSNLSNQLAALFANAEDYMFDCFKWLADRMNISFGIGNDTDGDSSYDDSDVINWLKRIYESIPKQIIKPSDPINETDEMLDWWSELLAWIADKIGGLLGTLIPDIGELLDDVTKIFPFSVPWDIMTMLGLLSANRVTPNIVITIPAISGWWSDCEFRIDLSPFESTMATVRSMEIVVWVVYLLMKTWDILEEIGKIEGWFTGNLQRMLTGGNDNG